ncbi:MAG: rod-binding protein [Gemmatimonadaceae bacterium]
MTSIGRVGTRDATLPSNDEAGLRRVARQLEGVFVQQIFKAMRDTVPHDGAIDGGAGEEMFTGMMDEHISSDVPAQWSHGIGEALVRQLRGALQPATAPTPTSTPERAG